MANMERIEEVKQIVEEIKALDLRHISPDVVKALLKQLPEQLAIVTNLKKGTEVCRTRVVEDISVDIPTRVSQISYNPNPSVTFGRAHLIGESVYYGSVSTEMLMHYFNTPFEIFRFDDATIGRKHFVTSKWLLKEDLSVVLVGSNLINSKELTANREKFFAQIKTLPQDTLKCARLIDQFLSSEFSKKVTEGCDYEYKISASYCSLLFSVGIKGILYPSVGSNGAGLNIVLDRSIVDTGILAPKHAIFGTLYHRYKDVVNDYSMKALISDGILRWQDTCELLTPQMKKYYMGLSDDNSFQKYIPFKDLGNDNFLQ